MSDRFGDGDAGRAVSPPSDAGVRRPASPFSWAVPPTGPSALGERAGSSAVNPAAAPLGLAAPTGDASAGPPPAPAGGSGRRPARGWLPVAVVAALVGGGVGARSEERRVGKE